MPHTPAYTKPAERQRSLDVDGRGRHAMTAQVPAVAYGRSCPYLRVVLRREFEAVLEAHRASCELEDAAGCPMCGELAGAEHTLRTRRWSLVIDAESQR